MPTTKPLSSHKEKKSTTKNIPRDDFSLQYGSRLIDIEKPVNTESEGLVRNVVFVDDKYY